MAIKDKLNQLILESTMENVEGIKLVGSKSEEWMNKTFAGRE